MAKIIQISDFVGKYAVSKNAYDVADLQRCIDKYEVKYIYDLLGVTLGNLLFADITSPFTLPVTVIYQDIFKAIDSDNASYFCNQIRSNGIKEMLLGFIYFEYVRTKSVVNTPVGSFTAQNEASILADWSATEIYTNYNESIKSYKTIQNYININFTIYPTFNGFNKTYTSQFI